MTLFEVQVFGLQKWGKYLTAPESASLIRYACRYPSAFDFSSIEPTGEQVCRCLCYMAQYANIRRKHVPIRKVPWPYSEVLIDHGYPEPATKQAVRKQPDAPAAPEPDGEGDSQAPDPVAPAIS